MFKKQDIIYLCDPEKAVGCSKGEVCWYVAHGPCKCTKKKQWSKSVKNGKPAIATDMDIWNEEYREWMLQHPGLQMEE